MMAEFVPARRPAPPANRSTSARRPAGRWRLAASVAVVAMLGFFGTPAVAATTTPQAAAAVTSGEVTVSVTPTASASLRPDEALVLTVTIENGTDATVPVGTVDIALAQRALTTRSALESWLRPSSNSNGGDVLLTTATPSDIAAGETLTVPVTVPAAEVGLTARNAWGARGIAARLTADDVTVEGRGTFVWDLGEDMTPVNVATALPLTTPASPSGVISSDDLAGYTAPSGLLSRQLDAVTNRPVAIAIDPMIIASIRLLGNAAPASAVQWLDRLAGATNDIFPLGYADADASLEAQAGAATLLAPLSFEHLLDPARFAAPTETASPTATVAPIDASAEPTTNAPFDGTLPTTAELLDWNYTTTDIAWPGSGHVARADLKTFAANGLTTTILSGGNVRQKTSVTPNSLITYSDGRALVTDDALSAAISRAAQATTDAQWRTNVAEAQSLLAIVSAEDPREPRTLLAAFDRNVAQSATRIGQTLDAVAGVAWETPATLAQAIAAPVATTVDFRSQAQPEADVTLARQLLQREAEVTAFSASVGNPLLVTAPQRLDVLALLNTAWAQKPARWAEQVTASLAGATKVLTSVTVTTRGPINVAADRVDIPITLRNELSQPVTVRVQVVPSNGRLLVESDIDATIDANSAQTITVPVTAAVGNGEVALRVTMYSPAGVVIGQPAVIAVNVHADWEGIGAWVLASVAFLFFGFGIWRNILRRRKERTIREDERESSMSPNPVNSVTGLPVAATND
ncbi:hypothetical protein JF66_11720 [Cryobacterium sp. MLB-32]|uniref:DUF6049 family protein n=1 Tax=Cryobacterium sp. MLB-32 TaxID=1529318 RepID=UPI0004E78A5D|nr:DUF6049 family protein [Cryobacterium sp. MLB-32]KFF59377.1 hypothetical protein JF66_11720 [Cryobacterium sp. MLB-32]